MASNGAQSFAPVLSALATMQSNVDRPQKSQAHEYLEKFQKSVIALYTKVQPGSLLNRLHRRKHGPPPSPYYRAQMLLPKRNFSQLLH